MDPQSREAELLVWIADEIRARGPITIAQFMEWALYHPRYGYYTAGPTIGPRGDFTTSPEASPAFGALLAKHVAEIDELLREPERLDVVECGPGTGSLANQMLNALSTSRPSLRRRLRYWLVEISPALVERQRSLLLPRFEGAVRWAGAVEELPEGMQGAMIANELVDAFPVHVLVNEAGEYRERFVDLEPGGGLRFVYGEPSRPELADFVRLNNIDLKSGQEVEISPAASEWLRNIGRQLGRGVVTLIDYGAERPERYSEARKEGTLLGYYRGRVSRDILAHPGRQDLTALVDFSALEEAGRDAGLEVLGLTRQAHFLIGLGLGTNIRADGADGELEAALELRRGLQALVSMEGLGRFHVLLLGKEVDPSEARLRLSGLKYAGLA